MTTRRRRAVSVLLLVVGVAALGCGRTGSDGSSPTDVSMASTGPSSVTTTPSSTAASTSIPFGSEALPSDMALATRPPADVVLAYPDGCAAYGISVRRCAYIADWAIAQAGIGDEPARLELLGDPVCEELPEPCVVARSGWFAVRVRVVPTTGSATDHVVNCNVGTALTYLCTETPRIEVLTPLPNGYQDLPCGTELGAGGCASPVPSIDPVDADGAEPLSIPSLTIPIDHEGPYAVDVGSATLPNGILSETVVTLTDDTRLDVLIPEGIRMEIIGEDGNLMVNQYDHGWRPGLETVQVRLVFDVDAFDSGAELVLTDLLVR